MFVYTNVKGARDHQEYEVLRSRDQHKTEAENEEFAEEIKNTKIHCDQLRDMRKSRTGF